MVYNELIEKFKEGCSLIDGKIEETSDHIVCKKNDVTIELIKPKIVPTYQPQFPMGTQPYLVVKHGSKLLFEAELRDIRVGK